MIRGVVPQCPGLAAPQQQGKSDCGAATLRINIAVRGGRRTRAVVDQAVAIV